MPFRSMHPLNELIERDAKISRGVMVFFDVCDGSSLIDLGALIYLIVAPYTARRDSFVHFYF